MLKEFCLPSSLLQGPFARGRQTKAKQNENKKLPATRQQQLASDSRRGGPSYHDITTQPRAKDCHHHMQTKNILPACPAHYLARPPLNTTGREIASLKIAHRWHEPPYALQTPGFAPSTQIVSASAHPSLPFKHRAFALPLALALAWTAACLSANTATRSSFDNCFAFCLILCLFRCSFFNC